MLPIYFYMFIILSMPSLIFALTMFILTWQNKINYQSQRRLIGGIAVLITLIIYIFDIVLLHFFNQWILFLQAAPPIIVNGIIYFKYADKNGDDVLRI